MRVAPSCLVKAAAFWAELVGYRGSSVRCLLILIVIKTPSKHQVSRIMCANTSRPPIVSRTECIHLIFWWQQLRDVKSASILYRFKSTNRALVVNRGLDFCNVRNRLSDVKLIQINYLLRKGLIKILLGHWGPSWERYLALHELHRDIELVWNHAECLHMLAPSISSGLRLRGRPYLLE